MNLNKKETIIKKNEIVDKVLIEQEDINDSTCIENKTINNQYNELQKEVTKAQENLINIKNNLKKMYKIICKQNNLLNKKKTPNKKKMTGFSKPNAVPESLKELLNLKEANEELSRPEIIKKIHNYINVNNLKSTTNNRIYRVDDKLSKALKLSKDDINKINETNILKIANPKAQENTNKKTIPNPEGLNFFNIQKWVAKLYKNIDHTDHNKNKNIIINKDDIDNENSEDIDITIIKSK